MKGCMSKFDGTHGAVTRASVREHANKQRSNELSRDGWLHCFGGATERSDLRLLCGAIG